MHGIIPYMFDYWADPVVHLLLLTKELLVQMNPPAKVWALLPGYR